MSQRAEHHVGFCDGAVQGSGVGDIALHDHDARAQRAQLVWIAHEHGDGVVGVQRLGDKLPTDAAGGSENGEFLTYVVHGYATSCAFLCWPIGAILTLSRLSFWSAHGQ